MHIVEGCCHFTNVRDFTIQDGFSCQRCAAPIFDAVQMSRSCCIAVMRCPWPHNLVSCDMPAPAATLTPCAALADGLVRRASLCWCVAHALVLQPACVAASGAPLIKPGCHGLSLWRAPHRHPRASGRGLPSHRPAWRIPSFLQSEHAVCYLASFCTCHMFSI